MTNTVEAVARNGRPPRSKRGLDLYDNDLIKAKTTDKTIDITLSIDFAAPEGGLISADDTVQAKVLWVDKYAVKFQLIKTDREVWISKVFLAGVWL